MPKILVCAGEAIVRELEASPVFREGPTVAASAEQALQAATAQRPSLVVVERDLPRAEYLVSKLRADAATHAASIVVVAGGDMRADELGLISAGANAVLRLPVGPDWDARLERLLHVPTRKQTRVPVLLAFEGSFGSERVMGQVLNVSLTGMLVESSAPFTIGSQFDFEFQLHGFESSGGEVKGSARIVRFAGPGRFGVEFAAFHDIGGELLRRFLLVP
jgi:CheY-like chemotaxis protein